LTGTAVAARAKSGGGFRIALALALAISACSAVAQDQDAAWPARAVRVVVPSSAGGGTDGYARLLTAALSEALKQRFVVDNRPGASGVVGAEIVAKSAPDGYTILVSSTSALVINPSLQANLPYDAERDFTPVARGVISPNVWTAHPSLPAKTLAALVALGKREPRRLTYGTAGPGSTGNIAVRMIEESSGARFLHVPYKGSGQSVQALIRGEIGFLVSEIATALPHIASGRAVPLAASHRSVLLPGTPTLAEAGYPNVDAYPAFSVAAPAGTPPAIVQRLASTIVSVMKSPAFRERLEARALIPVYDTPEEFAVTLRKEKARFADIIRRNRIVAE
jgi:tripartite-type tricarboxylate transporter receptor subunit TctC